MFGHKGWNKQTWSLRGPILIFLWNSHDEEPMRRFKGIEGSYHHGLIQSECKIKQPPGCCLFLVLWPFQSGQTTIKRQEITAGDFSFSDLTQRIQEYHFIYSLYMFWSCNMLVYRQALFQRWAFNQTHYLQFLTALLSGKRVQVLNLQDKVTTFDLLCPVSWLFWKQV